MPQRFLKPGIRSSPKWEACSWVAQSFYVRLITLVDDHGRYEAHPTLLKSECFPLREDIKTTQVQALCKELQSASLAHFYKVEGKEYVHLLNWTERVRGDSRWPDCPSCQQKPAEYCGPLRNPAESCENLPPESESKPLILAIAIPPALCAHDGFKEQWEKWVSYRKSLKTKTKNLKAVFEGQLEWLSEYSPGTAIEILKASIRNGWQGLFEPKAAGKSSTWELQKRLEAIDAQIAEIVNRGSQDAVGWRAKDETDRQKIGELRSLRKEIVNSIAGK